MENDLGINLIGFVDDQDEIDTKVITDKYVLGSVNDLKELVKKHKVNEVIISLSTNNYERVLEILDYCKNLSVNVKLNSDLFNIVSQKMDIEKYSDVPLVDASPRVNTYIFKFIKRSIDLIGAFTGILLLSPVFLLLGVLIKLTSKGPVFYSQKRIGKGGEEFKFYKFRSMATHSDGESEREEQMIEFIKNGSHNNNGNAKIVNENRVTAIGKIIRKTSLDELPQLFNVIKGDMSLVGPRPCLPYEYNNFHDWQKRKVDILPGCTGVWQISGRSSVSFNDSIVLDIYYINNMSPWLDLQIMLKTIPVMLFARGGK
jgi:undecaprenyl-phosphate galactose phosphotransferase